METSPLLMTHEAAQPQMSNIKTGSEYPDNRLLQEIFRRFKHTQVDPAEFACLKAIALFKPGITLHRGKNPFFFGQTKCTTLSIFYMYFQREVLLYAFSLLPETRGLKDPLQVENFQDQAQMMMSQHVRSNYPTQHIRLTNIHCQIYFKYLISACSKHTYVHIKSVAAEQNGQFQCISVASISCRLNRLGLYFF